MRPWAAPSGPGAGALIFLDRSHVHEMIARSAAPAAVMELLVASFTLVFALGATLTGFIFITSEE